MPPRISDRCLINDDMDNKSDGSDSMLNKSVRSSSGNPLGGTYQDEPGNRVCLYLEQICPSQVHLSEQFFHQQACML